MAKSNAGLFLVKREEMLSGVLSPVRPCHWRPRVRPHGGLHERTLRASPQTWLNRAIAGVHFAHELGRWLDARGLTGSLAATCFCHGVPLFVPAAPEGPLAKGIGPRPARAERGLLPRLLHRAGHHEPLHAASAGPAAILAGP